MYQPFPIMDISRGLYEGKKPWISPSEAFRVVQNARVRRGRVEKRQGFAFFGSLGHKVTNEALGAVGAGTTLFGHNPGPQAGLEIPVNNLAVLGHLPILPPAANPADYDLVIEAPPYHFRAGLVANPAFPSIRFLVSFGAPLATVGFIAKVDLATGFWFILLAGGDSLSGAAVTASYEFRPGLPVTGIRQFRDVAGENHLVVADTKRAFSWDTIALRFRDVAGVDVFTGAAEDLMDLSVASGTVLLNNRTDPPYLYDSVGGLRQHDTDLTVVGGPAHDVQSAWQTLLFKGRVIFFRPTEAGVDISNGARWGLVGQLEGFEGQDIAAAPTEAHFMQARLIGEQCIAFFDKPGEVFELVPEDDPISAFSWRRLRGDGDAGSRMGGAQFLDEAMIWGSRRLESCDGTQVGRVFNDEEPDIVSDESNLLRAENTVGVNADAYEEAWIGYTPAQDQFPTRILAANVKTQALARFLVEVHALGEYQQPAQAILTWDTDLPWGDFAWGDDALQGGFPLILLGDRHGRVFSSAGLQNADDVLDANEVITKRPFDMVLETEALNPFAGPGGSDFGQVRCGAIDFVFTPNPGVVITCEVGSDFEGVPELVEMIDLSPENPTDKLVVRTVSPNLTSSGPFIRLRDTSDRKVELHAIVPWLARAGPMRAFR